MKILFIILVLLGTWVTSHAQDLIPIAGSKNVKVWQEDLSIERALQIADSMNNIKILSIIKRKDDQIFKLMEIIKDYRLRVLPGLQKHIKKLKSLVKKVHKKIAKK